ncbi:MAG: CBS domain-containing protein [Deltaproteobacteria bacterium]|nr:CBS domain-containing protein [Deltaproteobacteria bacterium]
MNVDKVMNRKVPVCRPTDSVETALRKMMDHRLDSLPVVSRQGRLVGMVAADAARGALRRWSTASHAMSIEDVMARKAPSCRPTDALGDAEATLSHYGTSSIAVIDDGGQFLGLLFAMDAPFTAAALKAAKKVTANGLRAA